MYSILYKLFEYNFSYPEINKFYSRFIVRIVNLILPIYFFISAKIFSYKCVNVENETNKLIVSLTSFPARIEKVWLVIETILRQSYKPDRIILWLYEGEFNSKKNLPKELLAQEKRGLEIRFCNENLMPHKKYFYTMQEFPDANIITVDDDVFYPPNLIQKLVHYNKKYPNSIICSAARKISISSSKLLPYKKWDKINSNTKALFENLPLGVGGVLFPSNSLNKDIFNIEKLKKIALKADDLWLKIMSIKNNTKVVCIAGEFKKAFIPIIYKDRTSLMHENIHLENNDKVMQELLEVYDVTLSIFINN